MKTIFILALTFCSGATFAANYDCVNKGNKNDLATMKLNHNGENSIYGEAFGDTPKSFRGVAPEDYPVEVKRGQILELIDELGDGDTLFYYAVLPTNWNKPSFTLTIVEDNQRSPSGKSRYTWTDYACTRGK